MKAKAPKGNTPHMRMSPNALQAQVLTAFREGRHSVAEGLAQQFIASFPKNVFGWIILGAIHTRLGNHQQAIPYLEKATALNPGDTNVLFSLGTACHSVMKLAEAESCYRRVIRIQPHLAMAHSNLSALLVELKRPGEAEASARQAISIEQAFADAHYNLGNALREQDRFEAAAASYLAAIRLNPGFVNAHNNLGIVLRALGKFAEAEVHYRQALQMDPRYCLGWCNLGSLLVESGRLGEAEDCLQKAIALDPCHSDALSNLALLYVLQEKIAPALTTVMQSLHTGDTPLARQTLVACLKRARFTEVTPEIRAILIRVFEENWARPGDIAQVAINVIKLDPVMAGLFSCLGDAESRNTLETDLSGPNVVARLDADILLNCLLRFSPICDVGMESFLGVARRAMLKRALGADVEPCGWADGSAFFGALAQQCYINEYVLPADGDEIRAAAGLRDAVARSLIEAKPVPVIRLMAVAAYFPLGTLENASSLPGKNWPEVVGNILTQQISEPEAEILLRGTIPTITDIEDETSLRVKSQYEENPYPRWVLAEPPPPETRLIEHVLTRTFPAVSFMKTPHAGKTRILVAGCGTGLHPIETAQKFKDSTVLAIDLSLSSLAYAKRKTMERKLTSIEYARADLLKLASPGYFFDAIESVGVLHHLADPWAGWQALLSLLRPNGFMRLGFYSELARRQVVQIRDRIAEKGYASSEDGIRRCRQELQKSNGDEYRQILNSVDFFSTSACRDLLFHVQEHRMTLPQIEGFLQQNNLSFLGFEIEAHVLHAYKQRFPNDPAATNLAQWHVFENENPDTFIGMYQFWIQKPGDIKNP